MSQVWTAELRTEDGKGASRRLRHTGKIPAIIYGAGKEAKSIALASNKVQHALEDADLFNSVLTVEGAGTKEECVIKDLQRHPATGLVSHIDFQRVGKTTLITKRIPVEFTGQEESPGSKAGGMFSFMQQSVEVRCKARDLPTKLVVDLSEMKDGESLRLSGLDLPKGVSLTALSHGSSDYDQSVVAISQVKTAL